MPKTITLEHITLESFDKIRENNVLAIEEAKEKGTKVVGIYCSYGPREIVLAAGAIPVGLCGTKQEPIASAEEHLPRNLCPLIKSSYGFAKSDTCPYFSFSDFIVGETTCDGKKKMFELMQALNKKPIHIMHLPQCNQDDMSKKLWYQEIVRLKEAVEELCGVTIEKDNLWDAIRAVNAGNQAMQDLFDLNQHKPAVITGSDLVKIYWQMGFHVDPWERVEIMKQLVKSFQEKIKTGYHVGDEKTPRILITGTPIGVGCEKVVTITEACGGLVVALENCGSYKTASLQVDDGVGGDPLQLIAEKYLSIPCSVMTPNKGREALLRKMAKDFQVDGIIDLTWQSCHTYNVESYWMEKLCKETLGIPFLHLETDYSQSDLETLKVRIEAFLEIVQSLQA